MSSQNKLRKTAKRLHWGRGGNFLKNKGKGVRGLDFFNSSQRQFDKKILSEEVRYYFENCYYVEV